MLNLSIFIDHTFLVERGSTLIGAVLTEKYWFTAKDTQYNTAPKVKVYLPLADLKKY
jgi:hypothetical protein